MDGQKLTPTADGEVIPLAAAAVNVVVAVDDDAAAAVVADVDVGKGHARGATIGPAGRSAFALNGEDAGDSGRSADTLGIVWERRGGRDDGRGGKGALAWNRTRIEGAGVKGVRRAPGCGKEISDEGDREVGGGWDFVSEAGGG